MKRFACTCLGLIFVASLLGCRTASAGVARSPTRQHPHNQWSKPVNGLGGRIMLVLGEIGPGLRYSATLELKNVSPEPLAVPNYPRLDVRLLDANGEPVPTHSFSDGLPIPFWPQGDVQWGVIPHGAYLGLPLNQERVGELGPGRALLDITTKAWFLKPGKYVLKAKMFVEKGDGPDNQWTGQFDLPPVEIVLTEEQLGKRLVERVGALPKVIEVPSPLSAAAAERLQAQPESEVPAPPVAELAAHVPAEAEETAPAPRHEEEGSPFGQLAYIAAAVILLGGAVLLLRWRGRVKKEG